MPSDIRASWIALIAALLAGLYLCWRIIAPFLDVLMWAAVLVTVFHPVHRRLLVRLRHPGWTATVSTLLVIVTILGPVTLITLAVVDELRNIAGSLDTNSVRIFDFNSPVLGPWLRWLDQYVDIERLQSPAFLRATLERWTGTLANSTIGVVGGAVSVVVQMLLVVFTMFYLFRDGDAIRRAAFDMLPLERSQTRDVVARTKEVVGATVYGVIVIALIQGSLGAFIFWALGLPSPLLWGVVMFFLSMIPMAGAFLVWAPAALFLAFTGAWGRAVILVIWGVLVVGSIDNLLSPRLVGQRTRLHGQTDAPGYG
jgi:predicted PurR-regulated permease PerM